MGDRKHLTGHEVEQLIAAIKDSRNEKRDLLKPERLTFFVSEHPMTLNINLTPQLEDMVRQKVAGGLYNSASEVVREALRLMEAQDRLQAVKLEQLRQSVMVSKVVLRLRGTRRKSRQKDASGESEA